MGWAEPSKTDLDRFSESPGVCAILRAETRPGLDDVFESLLRDFANEVRGAEDGCGSYVVTRMIGTRTHFAVHAQFTNMEAFERHADTLHMQRAMPRINSLLATPISMEIFFAV